MGELTAGVVGVGMIGELHARIYAEDPRTDLVAVVEPDAERAEKVAGEHGARAYDDVQEMLADRRPDLATIATPEQQRHEPAVACAGAGVHLLLEKPLAPTLAGAGALVVELEGTGVTIMVNFILRSDPRYALAAERARAGALGDICSLYARRRGTTAGAEVYAPWTDLLISTAIHDLDAMTWIAGPVERVHAEAVTKRSAEWGKEDAVVVVLRFVGGAVGTVETSWVLPASAPAPLDAALHVLGTDGAVYIDGSSHDTAVLTRDGLEHPDLTHWPIGVTGVAGDLRESVARFVTAVVEGTPPPIGLGEARAAQEIVTACKLSLRDGAPVDLPVETEDI
jgi:predicted dehydrogenase